MSSTLSEPVAADASLHLLADHLLAALAADEIAPSLVRVGAGDSTGFDLGLRSLEGRHPSEVLLGTTAPPEVHAIGIVAAGRALRLDADPSRRHRVQLVSIVSRSGEHVHRIDGLPPWLEPPATSTPEGEQVDLLRRCLGLPTAPPPCPIAVHWAIEWLAAITDEHQPVPATPHELAARHPAMALLGTDDTPRLDAQLDLVDVARAFARVLDWGRLRALTSDRFVAVAGLAPEHARWLDDGAFSRYVLSRSPSLATLRLRAVSRLHPALGRWLLDVLDELDVPVESWPTTAR